MEKYIKQLLENINTKIKERWWSCPPHFWLMNIPDPYLIPPEDLSENEMNEIRQMVKNRDKMINSEMERTFAEIDDFIEGVHGNSMYQYFRITPESFPPADKLSDDQLDLLVHAILRLWGAYNFMASIPKFAPSRVVYPLLQDKMCKPTQFFVHGICGIEFCDYEPDHCPFGIEYCACKDFEL